MWFIAEIGKVAILADNGGMEDPPAELLRHFHIIRADSVESAYRKAERIASFNPSPYESESNGKKVIIKTLGIMYLDRIFDDFKSGAEVYDERCSEKTLSELRAQVFSLNSLQKMISYEREEGWPEPFPVEYGEDFDAL